MKILDIIQGNHVNAPRGGPNNNDPHLLNRPNPQDGNQDGENDVAGPAINPAAPFLTISADSGFLRDIQYFIIGFLASLIPSWRPIASPIPAPPAAHHHHHHHHD
jgi:hypothetical protein